MTKNKSTTKFNYISQWVAFIPPAKASGFSAPSKIKNSKQSNLFITKLVIGTSILVTLKIQSYNPTIID